MDTIKWEVCVCDDNDREPIGDGKVVLPNNSPIELACAVSCFQASFWPDDTPWTKVCENIRTTALHPGYPNREKWLEIELSRVI